MKKLNAARLFLMVLVWRISLFAIAWMGQFFFDAKPTFIYKSTGDVILPFLYGWANFDGVHYLNIIDRGYKETGLVQAFFPAFPIITRYLMTLINANPYWTGLLFANIAFLIAIILFYKLLLLDLKEKQVEVALILLLLFPTAFYFGAFYTESLFLLSVAGAFCAARKQNWPATAVFTIIATSTRVVGVALIPALIIELFLQQKKQATLPELFNKSKATKLMADFFYVLWNQKRALLFILGGGLGLLSYMIYLQRKFADPLYFFHVQSEFGAGRQESIITLPQVFWRYLKILWTARPIDWKYYSYVLEALAGFGGFVSLILAFKYVRLSYVVFSLGIFIIPTLTGTFSSLPRYLLPAFAIYLTTAKILEIHPASKYLVYGISTILLIINTMLFIQGYWVS
jgi:hypothetical protein